jgi:hypothetical protein
MIGISTGNGSGNALMIEAATAGKTTTANVTIGGFQPNIIGPIIVAWRR